MKIVAFGHRQRVGKDTAAELLRQNIVVKHPKIDIQKIGFATPLYEMAHHLYGWLGFKDKLFYEKYPKLKEVALPEIHMSPRQILIDLGTKAIRQNVWDKTWVKYLTHSVNCDILLITDMRFPNEFQEVKEMGGLCIRIDRKVELSFDLADQALASHIGWDLIIQNDGTLKELNDKIMWKIYDKII